MRNHLLGESSRFAHVDRTVKEETFRTPITMAFFLRLKLADHKSQLDFDLNAMSMVRFNGLLDSVMSGYTSQLRSFIAPLPFPLLQIARTLSFLWVFTLPLSLQTDNSGLLDHCFVVFFLTYAFIGLEVMSIELEDPFGLDANDIHCFGLCKDVMEDIYNIIDVVDGNYWAMKVRST